MTTYAPLVRVNGKIDDLPAGDTIGGLIGPYPISYPNLVINGDFQVWQRGTSITSTGGSPDYTADRWAMTRAVGTQIVSRQLAGLTGFQYCMRVARSAADALTNTLYTVQSCETINSIPFAGQLVTISLWARTSATFPGTLSVNVQYGSGVDEGPLAAYTAPQATFIGFTVPVPNTTWAFFQGSALCPAGATEIKVYFSWAPPAAAAAGTYYELTGIQVEVGSVASPFQLVPFADSLRTCQRYYQKSLPYGTVPAAGAGGAGGAQYIVNRAGVQFDESQVCLPVVMRITPAVTFYCPGAAGTTWWNFSRAAVSGASGVNLAGDSGFGALATQVAADLAGQLMGISWSANAEL